MSKKVIYEGPDISYHNGIVDMQQIRDAGYQRVALRAGYGKNNTDQRFQENAQACFHSDMQVMLYWFSYAYSAEMAKAEGKYAVEHAKKYWKCCPIAFDLEYDSINYARKNGVNITKENATEYAIAFLSVVKEEGFIPVIYTNKEYLNQYFDLAKMSARLGKVYVWYARYREKLAAAEESVADIWQYTSSGKVPGVTGRVDLNRYYTDFNVEKSESKREICNVNILNFQKAANLDGYLDQNGEKLKEDGLDGPKTRYVSRKILLKAKRTGLSWSVGSCGAVVRWHQQRCNEILGHSNLVDGKFGKNTRSETLKLQKKLNLQADGMVGFETIQAEKI